MLILANKQDADGAESIEYIENLLQVDQIEDRELKVFGTCMYTGEGLDEAFDWLGKRLKF